MDKENKINYAYITKAGILKVVDKDTEAAKEYSINGKYVKTTIECKGGYPVITYDNKRVTVAVYSLDFAVIDNGKNKKTKDGTKIDLKLYPEIYELYKACM